MYNIFKYNENKHIIINVKIEKNFQHFDLELI